MTVFTLSSTSARSNNNSANFEAFKVADGHASGIRQNIRNLNDSLLMEVLICFRVCWAIRKLEDHLSLYLVYFQSLIWFSSADGIKTSTSSSRSASFVIAFDGSASPRIPAYSICQSCPGSTLHVKSAGDQCFWIVNTSFRILTLRPLYIPNRREFSRQTTRHSQIPEWRRSYLDIPFFSFRDLVQNVRAALRRGRNDALLIRRPHAVFRDDCRGVLSA